MWNGSGITVTKEWKEQSQKTNNQRDQRESEGRPGNEKGHEL